MIILEIQFDDETAVSIKTDEPDEDKAEQKYHQTLSYAAVSTVPHHTVELLSNYGDIKKKETYHHYKKPEE